MVQRSREMRFAGGAAVFPGGRVDPADHTLAAKLAPHEDPDIAAARIAAIRETLEETGLMIGTHQRIDAARAATARADLLRQGALEPVLDQFGWTLDLARLTLYAHWSAPVKTGFDTRFFITNLGTGAVDIAVDATENTRLFWVSARDALDMAEAGEISAIFPTKRNLDRLSLFSSFEEALAHVEQHPVQRIGTYTAMRDGEEWLMIPDGHGYPVLGQPMASADQGMSKIRK